MCDLVTGEIAFGNGDYGKIPPLGSEIKAEYRYVAGGSNGNVPAKTIVVPKPPIPGVEVFNELAASGGCDGDDLEDAKRRASQAARARIRAITAKDYEYLARQASTEVGKVRCFPPKEETNDEFERSPGTVNMIIVPNDTQSRQPKPSDELASEVMDYVEERRTITSILIAPRSPFYVEIKVTAGVSVRLKPNQTPENLEKEIREKLFDFFHPVAGGLEGLGWEIGQDLYVPDVYAVIKSVPGVSYISLLQVTGTESDTGEAVTVKGVRLNLKDYQLICASELNDENYRIELV